MSLLFLLLLVSLFFFLFWLIGSYIIKNGLFQGLQQLNTRKYYKFVFLLTLLRYFHFAIIILILYYIREYYILVSFTYLAIHLTHTNTYLITSATDIRAVVCFLMEYFRTRQDCHTSYVEWICDVVIDDDENVLGVCTYVILWVMGRAKCVSSDCNSCNMQEI